MIPVMIVPVLTRPELLYRMLDSIDHAVNTLIIIDNGGCVTDFHALSGGRCDDVRVIHMPANLGVAGSWNLGIKATPFAPWWLIVNFDVVWPAGSLQRFCRESDRQALVLSDGAPPWSAFAVGDQCVEFVGLWDERLHPAYFEDNDYEERCAFADVPVVRSTIPVDHDNSSTLNAGYQDRNAVTFADNAEFYARKRALGDYSTGWSLSRRRRLSWD